jgi:serine/threonine-protein kinase
VEENGKTYADRYRIEKEVGRGGMAVVHRAFDLRMKRTVALKVLYPYLADKTENKIRFQREAEVVANLDHRNIVKIFDYSGIDSEENYIVAEFVEGTTLKRFAAETPIAVPEIGALLVHEIAAALHHAHRNGVIHRDVKPENVMIGKDGLLKLMDFGIAQIKDVHSMTVTGQMIGSPAHMSPEHIEGRKLDHRADIFSLGTVLYSLCVGQLPFTGQTPHSLLKRILDANYTPAIRANPAVGDKLSEIIDKCLKREPDERYQGCDELAEDLRLVVRESGFGDASAEVSRFFRDPEAYQEEAKRKVVTHLIEEGRRHARTGKVAAALRRFDRVLCIDPDQDGVVREMEKVRRKIEARRFLLRYGLPAAGSAAMLALGIYAALETGLFARLGGVGDEAQETAPPPDTAVPGTSQPLPPVAAADPPDSTGALLPAGDEEDPPPGPREETHRPLEGAAQPGREAGKAEDDPSAQGRFESLFVLSREGTRRARMALATTPRALRTAAEWARNRAGSPPPTLLHPSGFAGPAPGPSSGGGGERTGKGGRGGEGSPTLLRPSGFVGPGLSPSSGGGGERTGKGVGDNAKGSEKGGPAAAGNTLIPVTLEAFPPAVEIYVDDKLVGMGKTSGLQLPPGSHRLRLHHPACTVCSDTERDFELPVGAPHVRLKERIGYKPAVLRVKAESGGHVFVEGVLSGRTNDEISVKATTHQPWKVALKVLFDDSSLEPQVTSCMMRAGTLTEIGVPAPK